MQAVDGSYAFQSSSGQGKLGTTSPTLIHQQDLSGVIAGNSYFRYDDSVTQQKGRAAHSNFPQQKQRQVGQFAHNVEGVYFENSMRQSENDVTSMQDIKGNFAKHEQ